MEVRPLTEADSAAFWTVRLRAFREHPMAFGSSFEEERDAAPTAVVSRFRDEWVVGGVMLGAFVEGQLVGTVGVGRSARRKERHKATIRAVYVAPEVRGRGVARALLVAAIERARSMVGIEVLQLSVGTDNLHARSLYASLGFETYGIERHALKIEHQYVDEALMALRLVNDGVR